MKVKTSELSGKALDWAVAKATRKEMPSVPQWILWDDYHPTTNWRHCGTLIEQVDNFSRQPGGIWAAVANGWFQYQKADTPMVAICLAVVAAKLGDEVDIPDELMGE